MTFDFRNIGVLPLVAAAALLPLPALAGLQAAQWGMTPDQVEAAMAGKAPRKTGGSLDGKKVGNKGRAEVGGRKLEAIYYYDDKGLGLIQLRASIGECDKLKKWLTTTHGAPLIGSNQTAFEQYIWHDAPGQNRVRLLISDRAEMCDLHYERLADFEAADKARAARIAAAAQ